MKGKKARAKRFGISIPGKLQSAPTNPTAPSAAKRLDRTKDHGSIFEMDNPDNCCATLRWIAVKNSGLKCRRSAGICCNSMADNRLSLRSGLPCSICLAS